MEEILSKSINELECNKKGSRPDFDSYPVQKTYDLMSKKLYFFEPEDFRIMISQGFGLKYLIPLAIDILRKEPLIEANFYEGDLLYIVLSVDKKFWEEYPKSKDELVKLFTDDQIDYNILTENIQHKIYTAYEELTE